jgi:hypothetical protein
MSRTIHLCQSVEGALKNWKKAEWKSLAKSNNCSIDDMKEYFWNCLKEGKLVLPIGECDNFDYKKGCLGHENRIQVLQDNGEATSGGISKDSEEL